MYIKKGDSMINLKKNDKLIIIIAVAVVIVAGIGIAAYNPPDDDENGTGGLDNSETLTYLVDWEEKTGSLSTISDFVSKNSAYEGSETITKGNVKSVTFNLSWTDDLTFLGRFGFDTLYLEVTTSDGMVYEDSGTSGVVELVIDYNDLYLPSEIEAENDIDGEQQLNEDETKTFDVKVVIQVGEKRIIRKLREKGNDFELTITYEYYDASLAEGDTKPTGQDNEDPDDPEEEQPAYLAMLVQAGLNRW